MKKLFSLLVLLLFSCVDASGGGWQSLGQGLDFAEFPLAASGRQNGKIYVVRLDPNDWELVLLDGKKTDGRENHSVKNWCRTNGLTGGINAGMYGADYATHVGHMRSTGGINNDNINSYKSVAAFGPKKNGQVLPFRIFDLDAENISMAAIFRDYHNVLQNLRLIKRPRENRWGQQQKVWSEAALGEDTTGNVLLLFCTAPLSMHDFIEELLALPIELVAAQHLEGGQEAQLYVGLDDFFLELSGPFVSTNPPDKADEIGWPVPNVLGFRPRSSLR